MEELSRNELMKWIQIEGFTSRNHRPELKKDNDILKQEGERYYIIILRTINIQIEYYLVSSE